MPAYAGEGRRGVEEVPCGRHGFDHSGRRHPRVANACAHEEVGAIFIRQATAAKLGNKTLWALELAYYLLWTASALLSPRCF
ncbi:MAG: hypothetical protein ABWK05_01790 [Pyrobaculum sp.]